MASGSSGDTFSGLSDLDRSWEDDNESAHDWDLASQATAGETGIGGGHNLVPPGTIGEEFRSLKDALGGGASSPMGGCTPQRDPYHGRTMEPKCAFATPKCCRLVRGSWCTQRLRRVRVRLCVRAVAVFYLPSCRFLPFAPPSLVSLRSSA